MKKKLADEKYSIRLSNADLNKYLSVGTRKNYSKQKALNDGKKVILTSESEIKDFINESIEGNFDLSTVAYGIVNDALANDVSSYSNNNINISNFYLELVPYDIYHAFKEHSKAKEEGDIDLSLNDFEKIPENVDNYDELVYATKYKSGNTRICISKKIAKGRILIIETVSKSHGSLKLKNAIGVTEEKYISEYKNVYKKRNSTNTRGEKDFLNISLRDEPVSKNSIPNSAKNVNNEKSNDSPSGQYSLGSPIQQMRYNPEAYAKHLNRKYQSKADSDAVAKKIKQIVAQDNKSAKAQEETRQKVYDREDNLVGELTLKERLINEVAVDIAESIAAPLTAQADEILSALKEKPLRVNEKQEAEIKYQFGTLTNFRRDTGIRVVSESSEIAAGLTTLEDVWNGDWVSEYPNLFDSDINDLDMPIRLAEIVDKLNGMTEELDTLAIAADVADNLTKTLNETGPKAEKRSVNEAYRKGVADETFITLFDKSEIADFEASSMAALAEIAEYKPNIFKQIVDWVKRLILKLRGTRIKADAILADELERNIKTLEDYVKQVYNSRDTKKAAENSGGVSAKYSLAANAKSELHKALYDKNYRNEVLLRDETPEIMLSQKGVINRQMVMNASHIRENVFTEDEARNLGLKVDEHTHYHGIGENYFLKIIDSLDNVKEAYRGTKNASDSSRRENYFLLVTEFKDESGNIINVPVFIDELAQCNCVFIQTNKIATVFGREDFRNYINRQVSERNLVRIKNKSKTTSEGDALVAPAYESFALNDSISNPDENVKQKQLDIINETNPMWDDYHTGIRTTDDIRTWAEVLKLNDESEGQFVWGDFSRADAEQALKDGTKKERDIGSPRGQTVKTEDSNPSTTARRTADALSNNSISNPDEIVNSQENNDNGNQNPSFAVTSQMQQLRYNPEAYAKYILRRYGSKADSAEVAALVRQVVTESNKGKKTVDFNAEGEVGYTATHTRLINELSRKIVDGIKPPVADYAQDVIDEIHDGAISLDERQKAEIEYEFGSLKEFKRQTGVKISEDGLPLDIKWQQWADQMPNVFEAETTSPDMPSRLADIVEKMKSSTDEVDVAAVSQQIANEIQHTLDNTGRKATNRRIAEARKEGVERGKVCR